MSGCLFCRIVAGEDRAWIVWESPDHVAFLTPFPNTPGVTVVAPRKHLPGDVLRLPPDDYSRLLLATRNVDELLRAKLDVRRCAVVIEGYGVDHAHCKLFPLHGIPPGPWKPILSHSPSFALQYEGYVSSHDGPRALDLDLDRLADQIRDPEYNS